MERSYYMHAFETGELHSHAFHVLEHLMADIWCARAFAW